MLDNEGKEAPGNRGYKYFGAAKDLPGVRELFEQEPPSPSKKHRGEMMKNIDADYYGYMDDDDGLLIPSEEKCEKEAIRKKLNNGKIARQMLLILMNHMSYQKWIPTMKIMLLVDHLEQMLMLHQKIMYSLLMYLFLVKKKLNVHY